MRYYWLVMVPIMINAPHVCSFMLGRLASIKLQRGMLRSCSQLRALAGGNEDAIQTGRGRIPRGPTTDNTEAETQTSKKRKVALVVGYIGTGYYGLQYHTNPIKRVPTIEEDVEAALYWYVHAQPCLFHQLAFMSSHIGLFQHWNNCCVESRKSAQDRMDKIFENRQRGPCCTCCFEHEASGEIDQRSRRALCSERSRNAGNMQVEPEWIQSDNRIPTVIHRLNAELPDAIRAFSCYKVPLKSLLRYSCAADWTVQCVEWNRRFPLSMHKVLVTCANMNTCCH